MGVKILRENVFPVRFSCLTDSGRRVKKQTGGICESALSHLRSSMSIREDPKHS